MSKEVKAALITGICTLLVGILATLGVTSITNNNQVISVYVNGNEVKATPEEYEAMLGEEYNRGFEDGKKSAPTSPGTYMESSGAVTPSNPSQELLEGVWEGEYSEYGYWRNIKIEITNCRSDGFFDFVMTLTRHPNAPTAGTYKSRGTGGYKEDTGEITLVETTLIKNDDGNSIFIEGNQYKGNITYEEMRIQTNVFTVYKNR